MFTKFAEAIHQQYTEMAQGELFTVDTESLFDKYLASFPAGSNPIYRTRTEFDCQTCKQFIKRLGKVVSIKSNCELATVWDTASKLTSPFGVVAAKMAEAVRESSIVGVFRTKERKYGNEYNYDSKDNIRYDHLYGEVSRNHYTTDPDTKRSEQAAIFQVLSRGLMEIKADDLDTVLNLIESNGLYRGDEHKPALLGFKKLLADFNKVCAGSNHNLRINNNFIWSNLGNRNARFRNTVIGTLLTDLAEGKDLDQAVKSFETKVAPMNYKRPTSVITQKMVEQAVETLSLLGLSGAIQRRYAKMADISVNDVLFVDNASAGLMQDGITKLLESSIKPPAVNFKNAKPVTIDEFLGIIRSAKSVDLLLENRHTGNFVSLTAPMGGHSGEGNHHLFKWDNNFAWSYDGDVTDSVKQRVKSAGGNVNALLRVSLSWYNFDDLDLHCLLPTGEDIYYGNKRGILDVDMNAGAGTTRTPVENLAFTALTLSNAVYKVFVNQFRRRETIDVGFAIEVEYGGVINQYSYASGLRGREIMRCFDLKVSGGRLIEISANSLLSGGSISKEKWGVKTESLVPVAAIMNSPNHWQGAGGMGAKHTIFALEGCKNPDSTRGIYNEFLRNDLEKHRKVFEVLGAKTKCVYDDDQLSGLGFTAARGDSVTVVVDNRPYCISF